MPPALEMRREPFGRIRGVGLFFKLPTDLRGIQLCGFP
jgi:hypothetical protein